MIVLGLFVLALVVGIYGTIIGAGGGFVLIPALIVLFDLPGVQAVGTGAVALSVIAATGAVAHDRGGLVHRKAAGWFAVGTVPMALFMSSLVADRIDAALFTTVLGVILLGLAIVVLFGSGKTVERVESSGVRPGMLVGAGSIVGALGGLFSVGGGLLTVPFFSWFQGMRPHRAAATTQATAVATSTAAAVGHTIAGNVQWGRVAPLLVGAFIGSTLGARAAGRLSAKVVLALLATGLVIAGVPLIAA